MGGNGIKSMLCTCISLLSINTNLLHAQNDSIAFQNNLSRIKRQFPAGTFHVPFPAGWPFIQHPKPVSFPGFPQFPVIGATHPQQPQFPIQFQSTTSTTTSRPVPVTPGSGSCVTRNGFQGNCATFRQCYPFLYSSLEGEPDRFRNPNLAEDLKERAGPCEQQLSPTFLIFKADWEARRAMICCGSHQANQSTIVDHHIPAVSNHLYPQVTMRPPWALWTSTTTPRSTTTTTKTTTTTTRPSTTTKRPAWTTTRPSWTTKATTTSKQTTNFVQNLWPNWPPPFITHPPSHFTLFPTRLTTPRPQWPPTQATTKAPQVIAQWPPRPVTTSRPSVVAQWPQASQRPPVAPTPVAQPPASSSCGHSKIVGGSQATKGEFPWLVAIMRHGKQICGGSLIDSQIVLTAAHCFQNFGSYEVRSLRVQVGDYDIYSNGDGPVTIRGVSKIASHRMFNPRLLYNDIALLKLDAPVQLGSNGNNGIQPICLTGSGGYEGSTVTVAGWGGLYEGGPQPAIYRKVNLHVWTNQQCAAKYGTHAPGGITSNMVCAGTTYSDACRGDSGGPLMRNVGGRWEQIGIVSWGIGCGRYPGVYTRVDKYQDWIARNRRL